MNLSDKSGTGCTGFVCVMSMLFTIKCSTQDDSN